MSIHHLFRAMVLITLLFFLETPLCKAVVGDTATLSLAGSWKFALDPTDEGLHKKWFLGNLNDTYLGNILFDQQTMGGKEFVPSLTDEIILPTTTDIAGYGLPDQSPWINYLQRKHKYIGVSWFQKIVTIPPSWEGYKTNLLLERVKWQSRVWVDGKEVSSGAKDGLVTSHQHDLGFLKPGRHLISIRIDNRMIHPIGDKGHNYTELTESIWNGIIGKIELQRKIPLSIRSLQFFPNLYNKSIRVKIGFDGELKGHELAKIQLNVRDQKGTVVDRVVLHPKLKDGRIEEEFTVASPYLKPWDEYNPNLYTVDGVFKVDSFEEPIASFSFGARDITTNPYKIVINNIPRYIRGNQEALGYPLTGHPPMDVDTWRKIFEIYKSYGLNQVRFHSSCPPKAAFQAADEIGIYVMVELVWMTSINAKEDLRPISATMGKPQGLGNNDRTIDDFVYAESKKILEQYGNHPSFCFFAFGNELDNINKEKLDNWIREFKADDPRRLYAGTTARAILPHDDFQDSHLVPGKGPIVNKDTYDNTTNYDVNYQHTKLPVIAHELGQYPVHPSWDEINKYTETPFRFINLEKARDLSLKNGVFEQDSIFLKSSGALQQMLYKSEIERQMRSRFAGGFNLLQMNDYSGQGEALVGWLDAFYDSKGITNPAVFKSFCNDFVVLSEFPKYTWRQGDTIPLRFLIHNSNPVIKKAGVKWQLVDEKGKLIQEGKISSKSLKIAEGTPIGDTRLVLPKALNIGKYMLRATDLHGQYGNSWPIWVYPHLEIPVADHTVKIVSNIQEAIDFANQGYKVLFLANHSGSVLNKDLAGFVPVFWSTLFFPGRGTKTLGAVIDAKHPLFSSFPTTEYLEWQWREVCQDARGFILDEGAVHLNPIVQPIDDFHSSRKIGSIFEFKIGRGKVLVCGYNIDDNLSNRFVAKQLRNSILQYMHTDGFDPDVELSTDWLLKTFATQMTGSTDMSLQMKRIKSVLPSETSIHVLNTKTIEIKTGFTTIGIIKLNIKLTGNIGRDLHVFVEDRATKISLKPNQDNWVTVQYFREDFDDQKLLIGIQGDASYDDVEIKEVHMIPEK